MDEYNYLIKNALIVEGTGKEPYKGSIGIKDDRVVTLGETKNDAKHVIDGDGLIALPGFIDAHSHGDWTLLWYPQCENYIMQGVTTFIGGQCGGSPAPLGDHMRLPTLLSDHLVDLDPYKYYPRKPFYPIDQVNEWMNEIFGWDIDWRTMGGFFEKVEKTGISMNYAPLVGHGTIRTKVMGLDYQRHANDLELAKMRELIIQAMDEGCIGMSAGRDYDPDHFASNEEMIDGVKLLKKYNGIFTIHALSTGRRKGVTAAKPLNEKITGKMLDIEVYKATGVPIHWAHLGTGWWTIPWNAPAELAEANLKVTIDILTREAKNPLDITWDAIPFMVRGGWNSSPYLASLFAPWCRELGSREAFGKWLRAKDFRDEVKEAIATGKWYMGLASNPNVNSRWAENIFVVKSESSGLDGKAIADIAEERETDPFDTLLDIISEDPHTRMNTDIIGVKEWETDAYDLYYTHPGGMVGLDFWAFDDKHEGKNPPYSIPGVYAFSAFPMFYIKYVRDGNLFTYDQAIQKTGGTAAKIHNLEGRGTLQESAYADIVLRDVPNLKVLGTELEPRRYPQGIEHVFVNGVPVVENGSHTLARPGRVLKRS